MILDLVVLLFIPPGFARGSSLAWRAQRSFALARVQKKGNPQDASFCFGGPVGVVPPLGGPPPFLREGPFNFCILGAPPPSSRSGCPLYSLRLSSTTTSWRLPGPRRGPFRLPGLGTPGREGSRARGSPAGKAGRQPRSSGACHSWRPRAARHDGGGDPRVLAIRGSPELPRVSPRPRPSVGADGVGFGPSRASARRWVGLRGGVTAAAFPGGIRW